MLILILNQQFTIYPHPFPMKIFAVLILFCSTICLITGSCTKTETKTVTVTDTLRPPVTIVGFWAGTYQVTGSPTSYYISFDLRSDSTFLYKGTGADANTYYGQGTYSVSGVNFSYTFTTLNLSQAGAIQTGTGTYTAATGTIVGNWQNQGTSIDGTFTTTKSQ
jgi:hypothetical protein